jgi:methyl-accepting chemotaxis protein
MKILGSTSIRRQFALIVTAFSLAMPAAVVSLTWVLGGSLAETRKAAAENSGVGAELFGFIGSLDGMQAATLQMVREKDPDRIEQLMQRAREMEEAAAAALTRTHQTSGSMQSEFDSLRTANSKCVDALLHGDYALANQVYIEESNAAFTHLIQQAGGAHAALTQRHNADSERRGRAAARARNIVLIASALLMAAMIGLSVLLVRGTNATIHAVLGQLHEQVATTRDAGERINTSAHHLASTATMQAASIQETSASSEEIASMTKQNAGNSSEAAGKMDLAAQQIADANQRLEHLVASMAAITASSDKVSRIIRTIDEIAFQTNILALNAAVEAARGGEAGLGFAVVADEVRGLARRCAGAASDTTALIADSLGKTRAGKGDVDSVASTISSLTGSASAAKTLIDEIRVASDEQARGIQQISQALAQMQNETQKIADAAEQTAQAGDELTRQVPLLDAAVERLSLLVV